MVPAAVDLASHTVARNLGLTSLGGRYNSNQLSRDCATQYFGPSCHWSSQILNNQNTNQSRLKKLKLNGSDVPNCTVTIKKKLLEYSLHCMIGSEVARPKQLCQIWGYCASVSLRFQKTHMYFNNIPADCTR